MKAIFVDDEHWMSTRFSMECESIPLIDLIGCFTSPLHALEFAASNRVDVAFLDVVMPQMSGLDLADKLREIYPDIIIIFISAHEGHMPDAFRNRKADYYLLKPYSTSDIQEVANRAQLLSARQKKPVYIETFGRFSVYHNGELVNFTSKHAKEIFAYLVDHRGTAVSTKELWYGIWETHEYDHVKAAILRKAIRRLRDILSRAGLDDLLVSADGEYRIDPAKVDCDYYQFLEGNPQAIEKFHGDYMSEYSWAEVTAATLVAMCSEDHICHKKLNYFE